VKGTNAWVAILELEFGHTVHPQNLFDLIASTRNTLGDERHHASTKTVHHQAAGCPSWREEQEFCDTHDRFVRFVLFDDSHVSRDDVQDMGDILDCTSPVGLDKFAILVQFKSGRVVSDVHQMLNHVIELTHLDYVLGQHEEAF
jgi:hypothetical protein